jgi:hypothetical protein
MFHYFKIPYFTCTFFTKFTYNEYIGPYFLSHVFLRFSPVVSPRWWTDVVHTHFRRKVGELAVPGGRQLVSVSGEVVVLMSGWILPRRAANRKYCSLAWRPRANSFISHPNFLWVPNAMYRTERGGFVSNHWNRLSSPASIRVDSGAGGENKGPTGMTRGT